MKTKLLLLALLSLVYSDYTIAQERTTVSARNSEISDNLDLKAVASIFGDSRDLQDFERRLNDPRVQLSNLDLNDDHRVDYLRVIESVEDRTHVILIQAVLGKNVFQDVATIDIERNRNNSVSIQVVGDVFMYGANFIYEPVYYSTPVIYASLYTRNYRPYCSTWNWNYYPTYYVSWKPFPVYRYRANVNHCINVHNTYRYVSYRKSYRATVICASNHYNDYERSHPHYSFEKRNKYVVNRYDLDERRGNRRGDDDDDDDRYDRNRSDARSKEYRNQVVKRERRYDSSAYDYTANRVENFDNQNTNIYNRQAVSNNDYNTVGVNRREVRTKESNESTERYQGNTQRTAQTNQNRRAEGSKEYNRSEGSSTGNRQNSAGYRRI